MPDFDEFPRISSSIFTEEPCETAAAIGLFWEQGTDSFLFLGWSQGLAACNEDGWHEGIVIKRISNYAGASLDVEMLFCSDDALVDHAVEGLDGSGFDIALEQGSERTNVLAGDSSSTMRPLGDPRQRSSSTGFGVVVITYYDDPLECIDAVLSRTFVSPMDSLELPAHDSCHDSGPTASPRKTSPPGENVMFQLSIEDGVYSNPREELFLDIPGPLHCEDAVIVDDTLVPDP